MQKDQTRYVGNNGLEYLNAFDAEKYGEGLSHKVEYTAPKIVKIQEGAHVPEKLGGIGNPIGGGNEKIDPKIEVPSTEKLEGTDDLLKKLDLISAVPSMDEFTLRQTAKELGVKAYAVTGMEKLQKAVLEKLEKSIA